MKIEQVAIRSNDPDKLIKNLKQLGIDEWVQDLVTAKGTVFADKNVINVATLNFNYQLGFELEVLKYESGNNWHKYDGRDVCDHSLSHMGLHVSKEEMNHWKTKMRLMNIEIAQEVYTQSHTNPGVKGRKYHYVVFDSTKFIGFDLKLIERIMPEKE